MLLWHVAGALFLFRWVFRDPEVDVRYLVLGAVVSDLIDLPIGTLLLESDFSTGELWMHTLVAPAVLTTAVLIVTRRGLRRRRWMAVAVGMLFHILLDGMWTTTEVFWWPLAGLGFPRGPSPYWAEAWSRALSDPWRWVREVIGAGYLVWLWNSSRLGDPAARRTVWRTGRLPARSRRS